MFKTTFSGEQGVKFDSFGQKRVSIGLPFTKIQKQHKNSVNHMGRIEIEDFSGKDISRVTETGYTEGKRWEE